MFIALRVVTGEPSLFSNKASRILDIGLLNKNEIYNLSGNFGNDDS
jgi:hypothetical protein